MKLLESGQKCGQSPPPFPMFHLSQPCSNFLHPNWNSESNTTLKPPLHRRSAIVQGAGFESNSTTHAQALNFVQLSAL